MHFRPNILGAVRSEKIQIVFQMGKEQYYRHKDAVKLLVTSDLIAVEDGDLVTLKYEFNAEYYGNVARNLEAVSKLIEDRTIIKTAQVNELLQGRSLIVEVLSRLDQIISRLQ